MKNRFKMFRKISISTQFFLNYMVLFFLLLAILAATAYTGFLYIQGNMQLHEIDMQTLNKDIHSLGIKNACLKHKISDSSYVEILDSNFIVTGEYNSVHKKGYQYPRDRFVDLLLGDNPDFQFYNCAKRQSILMLATPGFTESLRFEKLAGIMIKTFILSLILVILIYAKLTSVIILRPIQKLLEGVRRISSGDYSSNISFCSKNELGDLRDAINQMSDKIQNEMELREQYEENRKKLILYISHDLKTPLTNILGYCETLKLENDIRSELSAKYIDIIASNGKRANRLIQDLFELSKIGSERSSDFEIMDICETAREILINFIPELEQNSMKYEFDIPEHPILCSLNPPKLERAFGNIINNSIKYSGNGTSLFFSIKPVEDSIFITVKDTGGGISDSFKFDIFEPFVRGDESRNSKTGGTGLGLAITKRIIENHAGKIIIDRSYKIGCKFIIMLPQIKKT